MQGLRQSGRRGAGRISIGISPPPRQEDIDLIDPPQDQLILGDRDGYLVVTAAASLLVIAATITSHDRKSAAEASIVHLARTRKPPKPTPLASTLTDDELKIFNTVLADNAHIAKSDEQKQAMTQFIPLGRVGTDLDIAHAVAFLASEEAGYITGHTLDVNGGMYMG